MVSGFFLNGSLRKSDLDWKSLKDLKEANPAGKDLGLVCFLCFHGAQTSPKGKQHSYPESKHLCF